MADSGHLQLIKAGAELWNKWRADHPEIRPGFFRANLRCVNLCGADLTSADLREADLGEATLVRVSVAKANLANANLAKADLSHADLSDACLDGACLRATNLRGTDFYRSNLRHATLCEADVTGAVFAMADLSGAELDLTLGLTQVQLETANGSADTILPEGLRMPVLWENPKPRLAVFAWRSGVSPKAKSEEDEKAAVSRLGKQM